MYRRAQRLRAPVLGLPAHDDRRAGDGGPTEACAGCPSRLEEGYRRYLVGIVNLPSLLEKLAPELTRRLRALPLAGWSGPLALATGDERVLLEITRGEAHVHARARSCPGSGARAGRARARRLRCRRGAGGASGAGGGDGARPSGGARCPPASPPPPAVSVPVLLPGQAIQPAKVRVATASPQPRLVGSPLVAQQEVSVARIDDGVHSRTSPEGGPAMGKQIGQLAGKRIPRR